jgi:ribosomal-protein-serine acetyltransferase
MFRVPVDDEIELFLVEERRAEELFRLVDEDREHIAPWLPWVPNVIDIEDERRAIRTALEGFAKGEGFWCGIRFRGALVGSIGIILRPADSEAEIGYWVVKRAEGQGIVTRATRALTEAAFRDLGMDRVVIRCAAENTRSAPIPERLGFTLEGTLRQAERVGERLYDQRVYALLASEFGNPTSD